MAVRAALAATAAAMLLAPVVTAMPFTFEPISDTVWIKGNTETIKWRNELAKGVGVETIDIELGTGGSNRVTILETIVRGLPYPNTTEYIWTIPNATKYRQEGQVFCLHYVGRGKNLTEGGAEAPKDAWSTWFSLVNNEETYSRFLNLGGSATAAPTTSTRASAAATTTLSAPAATSSATTTTTERPNVPSGASGTGPALVLATIFATLISVISAGLL